ncbi:IS66 family insertion sequence element accessory protein TnpA [Prosthecobacter sp.]|uniref:IS66 family insertion sequence element accessory protein TnpA n=1 Tax=Prosthecobacter sp. TaxID=1965333 RepID=UPI003784D5E4
MDKTSLVLKRDERGRVRTPRERRAMLVAEFGRSGLSARRFAQLAGVRYNTFWNWLREHGQTARRGKKRTEPKPRLVEVCMNPQEASCQSPQAAVRITLPGGAEASLRHAGQVPLLAALLKALA